MSVREGCHIRLLRVRMVVILAEALIFACLRWCTRHVQLQSSRPYFSLWVVY